jgi:hypothetical protein
MQQSEVGPGISATFEMAKRLVFRLVSATFSYVTDIQFQLLF